MKVKNLIEKKTLNRGLSLLALFGLIALIIWGCTSPVLSSGTDQFVPKYFHEGWSQQIGDREIPLDNIHDYIPLEEGEALVFTCTLPEIRDGEVFLFYSMNKEVQCYVDGALIQNFTIQDGFERLKTPGSTWNQIDLDSSMSGKKCILIFNSPLGQYNSLCNIYFIQDEYVDTVRIGNFGILAISVLEIFLMVIIIGTTGIIWKQPHRKKYLFSIANYFFIVLLWLLAKLNFYDLIFGRPDASIK